MSINRDALFSSKTAEWETPQEFFQALDSEFHFTLDACATSKNAKCKRFFTASDNGLSQEWTGTVWCNPPYGKEIGKWCEKAYKTAQAGKATVVMLLHARTDTRWFHEWVYHKGEIRFVRGRLKFGGAPYNAPFPSMVVIYRRNDNS